MTRRSPTLVDQINEAFIEINEGDAEKTRDTLRQQS